MSNKELIERLRCIPDDDKYCGVDAGRTTTCHASWLIDEAADRIEQLEAESEVKNNILNGILHDTEMLLTGKDTVTGDTLAALHKRNITIGIQMSAETALAALDDDNE